MKILLTGAIQSFADKKQIAVLESSRRAKEGPVAEVFYLKFHTSEAYEEFKGRYRPGDGVQIIGLVRQIQTPIVDRQTKEPIPGHNGQELRNTLLAIEVREHKPLTRDEVDTIYAHGVVSLIQKELRQSATGLPYWKARVVYSHFKRPDEAQGQGDFYNVVAFGGQAESLDNLEKGDRFLIDYAVLANNPYEMRDTTHSDGTAITRNGLEMTLREFSFLPRGKQGHESPVSTVPDELPF